jgi:RNA polymerase sigma-70 factor (ECF subfamily)
LPVILGASKGSCQKPISAGTLAGFDELRKQRFQFTGQSFIISTVVESVTKVYAMKPALKKQSDAELLARYAAGDETAFREIVSRYKDSLYAFLRQFLNRRHMVEDVFQETFMQLFTSRASFDTSRPLRPWLFTIAANKAKDALRKQQRTAATQIGTIAAAQDMSFDDVLNGLTADTAVPIDDIEREETAARVRAVIASMPENLREILILAYFNRFSYKQMAQILSIPIGTVKSRLHTAVGRFAKDWKAAGGSKEK